MKRYILLFLLIPSIAFAAPPSRSFNYTTGTTISSTQVTTNEDNMYNYLQSGVDTYLDNTIVDADVNASAGISDTKLNLATIAQAIQFNGALTVAAAATFAGQTIADLGTVTTGIYTAVDINGGDLDGVRLGQASQVTIQDADINSGTLDDVNIAGAVNQGDVWYDNGTRVTRLTPGTDGQYLQTQGAAANPQWADPSLGAVDVTAVSSADSGDISIDDSSVYKVIVLLRSNTGNAWNPVIYFNNDTGTSVYYWSTHGYQIGADNVVSDNGAGVKGIEMTHTDIADGKYMQAEFILSTFDGDGDATINGTATYGDDFAVHFGGFYEKGATATSISIQEPNSRAMTGNIYLYKLDLTE